VTSRKVRSHSKYFKSVENEIFLGNFAGVEALKEINPDLKTIISIGGWNAGNAILSPIAASAELRANLIASCFEFFDQYGFNGLDIDWEYPEAKDKVKFLKKSFIFVL
jgi:chitinase